MTEPEEAIRAALSSVVDPELGVGIIELGMLRDVRVDGGRAIVQLALTAIACPLRARIQDEIRSKVVAAHPGLEVGFEVVQMDASERSRAMKLARAKAAEAAPTTSIPAGSRVIAVASGKGGVGKSTITASLGVALARSGYTVGLLDADIWGFSLPKLLGVEARAAATGTAEEWRIEPIRVNVGPGELRVVSMGFLTEDKPSAIMWRGLVLNRAFQHFVEDTDWSEVDYLLIDMPPGTGDIQMGLARLLPHAGVLVVTTPHDNAGGVAMRMVDMARKGSLPVLGVVENMAYFVCEHGERHYVFGRGSTEDLCAQLSLPLLARIPLGSQEGRAEATVPERLDSDDPGDDLAAISTLAQDLARTVAPIADMSGCTSRLADLERRMLSGRPGLS